MARTRDIFISYRRETGAELAEIIKKDLGLRGYSIFKDTHDLKAGHWREDLTRQINGCRDFILLVTPGALDRCKTDSEDVVLFEIRLALAQKKNFILVVKRGKAHSPEDFFKDLPPEIADLPKHNWIEYSNEDSDAKLKKIRSFLDSSPSVWELTSNRYGKQVLAGTIVGGLLLCGLIGWALLGRTGRIENKVEEIAGDTKATLKTTSKIQEQNQEIAKDTGEIRKTNVELMEKTREVAKDTGEIKQGIQNLGKLKGLVANPQTAADFYHNANVHRNDGNSPLAEDSFLEYFKKKTDEYFDPYVLYLSILDGLKLDNEKKIERVEGIIRAKPNDKGARLVMTRLQSKDDSITELNKMILASPDYLPAYLDLITKLPTGMVIDDLAISGMIDQFKKNGGFEGMKGFILDATNEQGKNLLDESKIISARPKLDPMKRLFLKVVANQDITLLWAGVVDNKAGRKILFTIQDSVLEIPLNSPDNPALNPGDQMVVPKGLGNGCFVAVEIPSYGKKKGQPAYLPRKENDIRIFPHAGRLEGFEPIDNVAAIVSYIDASGRKYTFPDKVNLLGGSAEERNGASLFAVQISRNISLAQGDFAANLGITPAQSMRSIQVSGRKEGPFKNAMPHMNIPTMNEVRCEEVPYLQVENGVAKVWIRGSTTSGKIVEPVETNTRVPAGVRWKTLEPAKTQPAARELRFLAPEKLRNSNYYVDKIAFSPDGLLVAAQFERAGIVVWEAATGEQKALFTAETTPALAFNKDSTKVSNGHFVFPIKGGEGEKKLTKNVDVFAMVISPDFKRVVTVDRNNEMEIQDFTTLMPILKINLPESRGTYRALAISPDGKMVATGGQWVDAVQIIDMETGKVTKTPKDLEGSATNLAYSPDGNFLLGSGQEGKVWVWNLKSGKDESATIKISNQYPVVIWNGTNPLVIDQGRTTITVYNARTGVRIADFSPPSPKFAVSPLGNQFAIADRTGIKLFELPPSKSP